MKCLTMLEAGKERRDVDPSDAVEHVTLFRAVPFGDGLREHGIVPGHADRVDIPDEAQPDQFFGRSDKADGVRVFRSPRVAVTDVQIPLAGVALNVADQQLANLLAPHARVPDDQKDEVQVVMEGFAARRKAIMRANTAGPRR